MVPIARSSLIGAIRNRFTEIHHLKYWIQREGPILKQQTPWSNLTELDTREFEIGPLMVYIVRAAGESTAQSSHLTSRIALVDERS